MSSVAVNGIIWTSMGPFFITNIGLRFSSSVLSVCFDVSVAIGSIQTVMEGFSIDLDFFNGKDLSPDNFPIPSVSTSGLAVAFNQSPLTITT
ncbi:hypothetical protein B0T24DRAFT_705892 [Lasiosphaeria ovina]|uniref:DUF6603 domain-containing protein n=1 Tax=Lasiosphaeria ovina TaxID=92902 RepID=A0AAE0N555_9PEZI|nr:hypothetical protein B0T24DRAFT_705892 [Lasiosphaeria ovina]